MYQLLSVKKNEMRKDVLWKKWPVAMEMASILDLHRSIKLGGIHMD